MTGHESNLKQFDAEVNRLRDSTCGVMGPKCQANLAGQHEIDLCVKIFVDFRHQKTTDAEPTFREFQEFATTHASVPATERL
jgi:hypothetical protein